MCKNDVIDFIAEKKLNKSYGLASFFLLHEAKSKVKKLLDSNGNLIVGKEKEFDDLIETYTSKIQEKEKKRF